MSAVQPRRRVAPPAPPPPLTSPLAGDIPAAAVEEWEHVDEKVDVAIQELTPIWEPSSVVNESPLALTYHVEGTSERRCTTPSIRRRAPVRGKDTTRDRAQGATCGVPRGEREEHERLPSSPRPRQRFLGRLVRVQDCDRGWRHRAGRHDARCGSGHVHTLLTNLQTCRGGYAHPCERVQRTVGSYDLSQSHDSVEPASVPCACACPARRRADDKRVNVILRHPAGLADLE
jgi:hypothetical protein